MSTRPLCFPFALLSIAVAACGGYQTETPVPSGEEDEVPGSAFVLSGEELDDGRGSLLDALRGKVPNFRIYQTSRKCPQISLRSHTTFETLVAPAIYVDGTRATDTCILTSLRGEDVGSVEFYPMGFTTRPGYATHAHGLILVFMRRY